MAGTLKDGSVIIADQKESSQIYNKGNFGYPLSGGSLELDMIEATFLLETGRLEVLRNGERMTFESLFTYSSSESEGFDIRYMVYRDIRQRGFVVKTETSDHDLSVFPRGKTLSNSRPKYLVKSVSERTAFSIDTLMELADATGSKGKELLFGIVDEEGDMTYYIVSKRKLSGSVPFGDTVRAEGRLIRDRVFIFDETSANSVYGNGAFGKRIDNVLQLSLIETCYLMKKGMMATVSAESGKKIGLPKMIDLGRSVQEEFDLRLKAFSDMRDNGLVVKTGFKYGTHFRVYENDPDTCHARFLVHAVDGSRALMWPEISRAVRLAHGVKKEILFCRSNGAGGAEYIEFKRFRP
ncbi:MAG: tRNA-intron lyase [Methanomassiliicoccaceae archaeon]|nr:tRNA-intron lyase [Methanomassiliicoccaceae archaeon]